MYIKYPGQSEILKADLQQMFELYAQEQGTLTAHVSPHSVMFPFTGQFVIIWNDSFISFIWLIHERDWFKAHNILQKLNSFRKEITIKSSAFLHKMQ